MLTVLDFNSPNIAFRKAAADQTYLLDVFVDGHELMNRSAAVVGNDAIKSKPELRALLGNLADWMRLYQQTLEQLEQEIKEAAA